MGASPSSARRKELAAAQQQQQQPQQPQQQQQQQQAVQAPASPEVQAVHDKAGLGSSLGLPAVQVHQAVHTPAGPAAQAVQAPAGPVSPASAAGPTAPPLSGPQHSAPAAAVAGPPLYDRLGGDTTLQDTIDILYKKLLKDPELERFFGGINLFNLKRHQTNFLTLAFGGNSRYSGKSIASAHSYMIRSQGLCERHFDLLVGHLTDSLRQLGIEAALVQEVEAVILEYRSIFQQGAVSSTHGTGVSPGRAV